MIFILSSLHVKKKSENPKHSWKEFSARLVNAVWVISAHFCKILCLNWEDQLKTQLNWGYWWNQWSQTAGFASKLHKDISIITGNSVFAFTASALCDFCCHRVVFYPVCLSYLKFFIPIFYWGLLCQEKVLTTTQTLISGFKRDSKEVIWKSELILSIFWRIQKSLMLHLVLMKIYLEKNVNSPIIESLMPNCALCWVLRLSDLRPH